MDTHSLIVLLLVGLVAGWAAGLLTRGGGFGLLGDMLVGVVGAFFGSWMLGKMGISIASGILGMFISALIGAVVLLVIVGFIRRIVRR